MTRAGCGARCSLRLTFGIVELPTQNLFVLPGHEGRAVRRAQSQEAGTHSAGARCLDFSGRQNCAIFIEPRKIDLPFCRPHSHVTGVCWSDREVSHRTAVDFPGSGADASPRGLDPAALVPKDEVNVALVTGLLSIEQRQSAVWPVSGTRRAAVARVPSRIEFSARG